MLKSSVRNVANLVRRATSLVGLMKWCSGTVKKMKKVMRERTVRVVWVEVGVSLVEVHIQEGADSPPSRTRERFFGEEGFRCSKGQNFWGWCTCHGLPNSESANLLLNN